MGSGRRSATPSAEPDPVAAEDLGDDDEGLTAGASWLELAVVADVEAVEAVSEILGRVAPSGTSVEPAFELRDEGLAATVRSDLPATVRAFLAGSDTGAARQAIEQVRQALGHLQAFGLRPIGDLETRLVHESDWADAWREHFPVLRIGRRIVIRPTWRRHSRRPNEVMLALDPGQAFGTGLHPTTRLCLVALEKLADGGAVAAERVLDLGSGSGILSIAAAKLGARAVLALDTDPLAVEATAANARRNRVQSVVGARAGTLPTGDRPFDVVLANLVASVLVALAGGIAAELAPGGRLVASGIFADREADVARALETAGLQIVDRLVEGDWVALVGGRSAA